MGNLLSDTFPKLMRKDYQILSGERSADMSE